MKNRILIGISPIFLLVYCRKKQEEVSLTAPEGFKQVALSNENQNYVIVDALGNGPIIHAVKKIDDGDGTFSYTTRGPQFFSGESNVTVTNNTSLLTLSKGDWFFYGVDFGTSREKIQFLSSSAFGTVYCGLASGNSETNSGFGANTNAATAPAGDSNTICDVEII